jgi:hypothetical protein
MVWSQLVDSSNKAGGSNRTVYSAQIEPLTLLHRNAGTCNFRSLGHLKSYRDDRCPMEEAACLTVQGHQGDMNID